MVSDSYTVVHPWTVMIEPLYTFVADVTVAGSGVSDHLTIRAEVFWLEFFQHIYERYSFVFEVARVSTGCQEVK